MLRSRVLSTAKAQCRQYTTTSTPKAVPILYDAALPTFQRDAFEPATPALLPRRTFLEMPAVKKWFLKDAKDNSTLNTTYLAKWGSTIVPLEISNDNDFTRIEQSFSFFLDSYVPGARAVRRTSESNDFFTSASNTTTPTAQVYLAQAPLADLPRALVNDVPTPEIVLKAGKGDVYDSSIWLGRAPTYTPLHRDPNPNLFVQLAGQKVVRLFNPSIGHGIFAKVQEVIGGSASATMRGEEMMAGEEKKALEAEVWDKTSSYQDDCLEVNLHAGDALFIPKGWWHSIKGIGNDMTGSVNWWFR
ncbi:Lysine-specific demethylase JMJ30 [Pseudocercospora fuligena]|uniref:Lysine-specific demethylase JMJ30 n=1 Tax=Pseudocercospora fuligena TaxID=685502 RepID=A0A8H6RMU2_9PEZI|nr:Lysine-specific demethylase JMJ30 [Pseudocercospora fuligena]